MNTQYTEAEVEKFKKALPLIKKAIKDGECSSDGNAYGVGANTYRCLAGTPSKIYRSWASRMTALILRNNKNLADQKSFDRWHARLCRSLEDQWDEEKPKQLIFPYKSHLVDLYLKWLCGNINWLWTNEEWMTENSISLKMDKSHVKKRAALSSQILKFGYCPLDSKALKEINKFSPGALLKKEQTLKSIYDKGVYLSRQNLIRDIAKHCGSTPLMFDFYVWPPARRWIWLSGGPRKNPFTL